MESRYSSEVQSLLGDSESVSRVRVFKHMVRKTWRPFLAMVALIAVASGAGWFAESQWGWSADHVYWMVIGSAVLFNLLKWMWDWHRFDLEQEQRRLMRHLGSNGQQAD